MYSVSTGRLVFISRGRKRRAGIFLTLCWLRLHELGCFESRRVRAGCHTGAGGQSQAGVRGLWASIGISLPCRAPGWDRRARHWVDKCLVRDSPPRTAWKLHKPHGGKGRKEGCTAPGSRRVKLSPARPWPCNSLGLAPELGVAA